MSQIQATEQPTNQQKVEMRSIEHYRQLTSEEQQEMLKKAKD